MLQTHTSLYTTTQYVELSLLYMRGLRWSKASRRLLEALRYIVMREDILDQQAKCLYTDLARLAQCSTDALLRSLRGEIRSIWEDSSGIFSEIIMRQPSPECPSVLTFFSLYAAAFRRGEIQRWIDCAEGSIRL